MLILQIFLPPPTPKCDDVWEHLLKAKANEPTICGAVGTDGEGGEESVVVD
jgi:hypothetical protein